MLLQNVILVNERKKLESVTKAVRLNLKEINSSVGQVVKRNFVSD